MRRRARHRPEARVLHARAWNVGLQWIQFGVYLGYCWVTVDTVSCLLLGYSGYSLMYFWVTVDTVWCLQRFRLSV